LPQGAQESWRTGQRGCERDGAAIGGKDLGHLEPADAMLAVTTAKAMVHSGDVPMVAVNRLGKGQAIYLNMDVSGYAFDRLNPNAPNGLQSLLESVLSVAGIGERVRVRKADGKRLAGTEVVIFANGVCEVVAIFRNPQLDDGGWGSYREKNRTGGTGHGCR